jgi:hypothetical protein
MIEVLAFSVLSGFALYYLVSVLLLEEKESHYGPFPSDFIKVNWVIREDDETRIVSYQATIFDKIRSLSGLYEELQDDTIDCEDVPDMMQGECGNGSYRVWIVRPDRQEVWTCPKCLSIWLAIPFYFIAFSLYGFGAALVSWFAIAGISHVVYSYVNQEDELILIGGGDDDPNQTA